MMDSTHPAGANDSEVVTTATGPTMRDRFRGFLPVVVDIETGGFNCQTDAILEIAMTLLTMSEHGKLEIAETHSRNVEPCEGANLDPSALEFTGIDPESPLRGAVLSLDAFWRRLTSGSSLQTSPGNCLFVPAAVSCNSVKASFVVAT